MKSEFSSLFYAALETAAATAEQQLRHAVCRDFVVELHGAGSAGHVFAPADAVEKLFLGELQ